MTEHILEDAPTEGVGRKIVRWVMFGGEICILAMLLVVTFMVPMPPGRWGKTPTEAALAALAILMSLIGGVLSAERSGNARITASSVSRSVPCVVCATVIVIVVVPEVIGRIIGSVVYK